MPVFSSHGELALAGAELVAALAARAIAARGLFTVALAGGQTPKGVYCELAREPERIGWLHTEVFWGDERCVPLDHPDSNYRMAAEALLSRVPVPRGRVHPVPTQLGADEAARRYAAEIRRVLGSRLPRFDLVLLGMGADGHTASLFPGTPNLTGERRLVIPTTSPKPPTDRVSLTLRTINLARNVVFFVTGRDKAGALGRILGEAGATHLPAGLVSPGLGALVWMVDHDAASGLSEMNAQEGARTPV